MSGVVLFYASLPNFWATAILEAYAIIIVWRVTVWARGEFLHTFGTWERIVSVRSYHNLMASVVKNCFFAVKARFGKSFHFSTSHCYTV